MIDLYILGGCGQKPEFPPLALNLHTFFFVSGKCLKPASGPIDVSMTFLIKREDTHTRIKVIYNENYNRDKRGNKAASPIDVLNY